MNRGRRRNTLPDLVGASVEFIKAQPAKASGTGRWLVTLNVNGWPHDITMWAKDELDVMKQVFELQRGVVFNDMFDVSA
jgi:hypothetical protein